MRKSFKKVFGLASTAAVLSTVFAQPVAHVVTAEETEEGVLNFESEVIREGEPIEGGELKVAMVGTPFEGVLNNMLYSNNSDATLINYFNPGILGYDENFTIDNSGFADVEFDPEAKTVKLTIPEGHTWHDGEPITIDDVIFPYYVIGHPDYTGVRYGEDYMNVVGMEEYHAGDAEEISGLERVDDYTLIVHYKSVSNSMLQAGGGISGYMEPEHILGEIPVGELEDSEYVRSTPVGFGPFKVDRVVPGEAVTYSAFDGWYEGRPNIDNVTVEVVAATNVIQEIKAGNYDIASLPADQYETYKDATNIDILGTIDNAFTYIGFKQGTWDGEAGEVKYDETLPLSNKAIRQAMAHAIDNNAIATRFYHGLRQAANSFITPNFTAYWNQDIEVPEYNPELAKQILEEAGFVDVDGDGFVETPEGEPLKLTFASMSGAEVSEPIATYYIQSWRDIGIDIELLDGQLHDMNAFYDRVESDDPEIMVYQAAFGIGGDPNPAGLWGRKAKFNMLRWATEENDKLLADIASDKSFDEEFRTEAFHNWQAYMMEELPAIPTLFRYNLTAVNKRVSHWDVQIGSDLKWSEIYLLSDERVAE